jgi:ABC-type polysaccharide/polyol phosphate export permease
MLGTLYIVFSIFLNFNIPHYTLFLLLGIILWNFFVDSTILGMKSIILKGGLIKKTYFKREFIVISANLNCLISFIFNVIIFFIFLLCSNIKISETALIFPVFIFELFILSLGVSYLVSSLYVRYRDMDHIWEVILQIGFWVTPIVYTLTSVPDKILKWYMLNPLARIINDSRNVVIYDTVPSIWHMAITLIICLSIYFAGLLLFKKRNPNFAEEI